jgi:hypothetical protein
MTNPKGKHQARNPGIRVVEITDDRFAGKSSSKEALTLQITG